MRISFFLCVFYTVLMLLTFQAWASGQHQHAHEEDHHEPDKGPQGGRLLQQDSFSLELTIFEDGVPPELRVFAYESHEPHLEPLDVSNIELQIQLHRIDGTVDNIQFTPTNQFLRGNTVIYEPHSFDVKVQAKYAGKSYQWEYDSYEGRTQIDEDMAYQANIKTEIAGSARIEQSKILYGTVHPNEEQVFNIKVPYQGRIQKVFVSVGDNVQKGDRLASIQSLESLENYTITAPATGVILSRRGNAGEITGIEEPLLILADLSTVWVDFAAFPKQYPSLRKSQRVLIKNSSDGSTAEARIGYISMVGSSASQSILVRVQLDNTNHKWLPGLLVVGSVVIAENEVPLAVKLSGLQTFRDFTVVFAKFGDTYEVRMLELGRRDDQYVEVLGGLKPGTEYVSGNSYLIKADILKSGASHDH